MTDHNRVAIDTKNPKYMIDMLRLLASAHGEKLTRETVTAQLRDIGITDVNVDEVMAELNK